MASTSRRFTPEQVAVLRAEIAVELISKKHEAAAQSFKCHPEIDQYLKEVALQARIDGLSRPWVFLHHDRIAGYVTLSASTIQMAESEREKLKIIKQRVEWPALLIGMLGVDVGYRGLGLGDLLLEFAIGQAQIVAEMMAVKFVVADVYDEPHAIAVYERNGFTRGAHKMSQGKRPKFWFALPSEAGD